MGKNTYLSWASAKTDYKKLPKKNVVNIGILYTK